ncbi:MAG: hypothetical protein H0U50_10080 [Pyrinomonadaceae bacterium]|nr:hypothetical protein [Pyrinomonadaceae bacterium]
MGYSNYKSIKIVVKKFHLDMRLLNLFENKIEKVEPSSWLLETLDIARETPITNEKSKSERIVSPILLEASRRYTDRISFFSGESLNVKPEEDLAGECDFFFALHPPKLYIDAPIISLAEAKDEDMEWGIAQCAAQMLGAKFYNEMEGKDIPFIYGCATDGIEWQFMKLETDVYYIDNKIFTDLKEILGVWHHIINLYL